jgi:hypothetical protein
VDSVITFFTDKTGLIAALAVLVGLVGGLLGIVRPMLQRRRDTRQARARLTFSGIQVTAPPSWSTAGKLRFQVMNSGRGKALLQSLKLLVSDARPSETLRMVEAGAPVPEHRHQVCFDPETREYDVRGRAFGEAPAALSFEENEVETFIVELTSTKSWWYRFKVVGDWYDTKRPGDVHHAESPEIEIDFPPDPAELLLRE